MCYLKLIILLEAKQNARYFFWWFLSAVEKKVNHIIAGKEVKLMANTNGDNRKRLQPWDIQSINIKVVAWEILPYCLGNFFSLKFQEVEMVLYMDLE